MRAREREVATACAGLAAAIALVVLVGWCIGSETLTAIVPGYTSMKVNTALCGLLLAAASLSTDRRIATGCALVVAAVVVATLAEYAVGTGLGIDQLLVSDPHVGHNPPGRMAPATAVCFAFLAAARLQLLRRSDRLVQLGTLVAFTVAFLAVIGYQFGADQLYALSSVSAVAVHTAVMLMLLAVGCLAAVDGGVVSQLIDGRTPGALLLRKMVPVALVLLPLLAYGDQRLGMAGGYGQRFGTALIVCCGAALILGATVFAGRGLDLAAAGEQEARRELERVNAGLVAGRDAEWARAEELSQNLAQERADFTRILETIDETVWSLQVTGSEIEVMYMGSASPTLFGGPVPPHLNALTALEQLVHEADRPVLEGLRRRILAGQPADIEVRVVGFDGIERCAWLRGTPRHTAGGTFFDGITTDVTERRAVAEHREALLRLEKARVEELNQTARMREDFVAVAGHELRSPLAAILGHAELLATEKDLSLEQLRQIGVIVRRSQQVGRLVDDFFELARLEAKAVELQRVPVDLCTAVTEAVETYQPSALAAGVTLSAEATPLQVDADPAALRRVLDNLLSNAVKYTPAGGQVVVAIRRTGGRGVLEVADTGIGIPEDERGKVFDHLFRASTARARGLVGTGIGLAVTKALVESLGGTITVAGRVDGGTVFTVALPGVAVTERRPA